VTVKAFKHAGLAVVGVLGAVACSGGLPSAGDAGGGDAIADSHGPARDATQPKDGSSGSGSGSTTSRSSTAASSASSSATTSSSGTTSDGGSSSETGDGGSGSGSGSDGGGGPHDGGGLHDAGHTPTDAHPDACTSAPGCTTENEAVCTSATVLGTCTKGANGCFSIANAMTCTVANGTGACAAAACGVGSCDTTFQTCGGASCQSVTDVAACGPTCTKCPAAPEHGTENCTNGTSCAFTCASPYVVDAANGVCSPPPPQLISPMTGNIVSTRTPTLKWALPTGGFTSVHVEVCANADHRCLAPVWQQDVTGTTATVGASANLDGHLFFWRAFTIDVDAAKTRGTVPSFTWECEGHGTASAPISTSWWGFADIEGDGVADLVAQTGTGVAEYQGVKGTGVTAGNVGGSFAGGGVLEGIGDFNGDGLTDVLTTGGVISGSSGGLPAALSWASQAMFFESPVALADMNGDGYADVAATDQATSLYVLYGSKSWFGTAASQTITLPAGSTTFNLLPIGDVNGDGYDDLLATDNGFGSNVGRAYVYLGSSSGFPATPQTLKNPGTGTRFGWGATRLGDVNGDGYADVLIVAFSSIQTLYIYYGGPGGLTTPSTIVTDFSAIVGTPGIAGLPEDGDFNGDGYEDVLLWGTTGNVDQPSTDVIWFGGPNGITAPTGTVTSPKMTINNVGVYTPCNLGDLNDDGISDFGIQNASANGPTQIFYGSAGTFPTTAATSIPLAGYPAW